MATAAPHATYAAPVVLAAGDITWLGVTQALPIVVGLLAYAALYVAGVQIGRAHV